MKKKASITGIESAMFLKSRAKANQSLFRTLILDNLVRSEGSTFGSGGGKRSINDEIH